MFCEIKTAAGKVVKTNSRCRASSRHDLHLHPLGRLSPGPVRQPADGSDPVRARPRADALKRTIAEHGDEAVIVKAG
jgi:hypothetical protein